MADNWKNNVLPGPSDLDLGSLEYDENTSLPDIAGKYTNLGSQVGGLAKAAYEDVHTRQTKLIGNDFGSNPMMYATYYQPAANDLQSEMRQKGTQQALSEGMERGKAAAEAEAEAAKNQYSQALDSYKNAKDAYANLRVAMIDSSNLPDGTDESEAANYMGMTDRDETRFAGLKNYTDQMKIDWSDSDVWSKTAGRVVSEKAGDTSNWKQEDWDNFWAKNDVGADFTRYYVSSKLEKDRGAEAAAQFNQSADNVLRNMDAIFDKVNNIVETLPELNWDVYLPDETQLTKKIGNDEDFLNVLTRDNAANEVANYRKDSWIEENIQDEYQDEIKRLAQQQKDEFTQFQKDHATAAEMDTVKAYHEELARTYVEAVKMKLKNDDAEDSKFNFEMKQETQNLNDVLKDVFGFDLTDMLWMDKWHDECPDEYESYKNQLSMVMGLSDTMEVADGERWYWTGKEYEQIPAGTPVFYAYSGALDEEGNIVDPELKTFVDTWKDYYSADVEAIGEGELSTKQQALSDAYSKYMQHVSAALMVNANLNVRITSDVYHSILANFSSDISKSDETIEGTKISDWLKDFKSKSQAEKYQIYTDLMKASYSKAGKFLRFSADQGGIITEDINYDKDSQAAGYSKFDVTTEAVGTGIRGNSEYANLEPETAAAYMLALTRSMEQFNNGTNTAANIDPEFMNRNLLQHSIIDLGTQLIGTVSFWESVAALGLGAITAPVTGKNAVDADFFGIEGTNAANVLGSIFSGKREYNMDDPLQATEYLTALDQTNREYAESVINPLLIDVYFGDKEFDDVRGVGDKYTSEGQANLETGMKMAITMGNMFLVNWIEGATFSGIASGIAKVASKASNSKVSRILSSKLLGKVNGRKGSDIYAEVLSQAGSKIDNLDDAYQARNVLADPAKFVDDAAQAERAAEMASKETLGLTFKADDTVELGGRLLPVTEKAEQMKSFTSGNYGVLTPTVANALSSLSVSDLDDMIVTFNGFVNRATKELKNAGATNGLEFIDVPLKNGQKISALEASAAITANRITGQATLALATGLSIDDIAALPQKAQNMLLRTLNGMTSASQSTVVNKSLGEFLRSLTPDDFKALTSEFINRNEINAMLGKNWDTFDTYRAAAAAGWERSGRAALTREFVTDALTDPLRDFKRNVSQTYVDREGNARVQTIAEYFTSPENLMQNLAMSTGHFAISRMYNQVATTVSAHRANKAWNAYTNTGDKTSEEAAKLYSKAVKLNAKAQKYSDKAWKKGMTYAKASQSAELSNKIVDDAVKRIFDGSGWDLDYSGKTKHFDNAEDYINFVTNKNMPTKEGLFVLANSTNIKAVNNYYLYKTQIGTAFNELGNLPKATRLSVLNTINKAYHDNIEAIKSGKGSFDQKNHAMYEMMKTAVIDANNAGEYGLKIRNLDKSLSGFFSNLEAMSKAGRADGTLSQQRIGYIPTSSMYFDGSYDDMIQSHRSAATRGLLHEGGSVDVAAANPAEARDVFSLDSILEAMNKGEKTLDVKDASGNVIRTVQLDYDGTNVLDMMVNYSNNYNLHKYIDPLMGDSRVKFGNAALQNNHAYIMGEWNDIQRAWSKDLDIVTKKLKGSDTIVDGKKVHVDGWFEKIAARAIADEKITKEQADTLFKKGTLEFEVSQADKAKLDTLRKKYAAAESRMKKAKQVLDQGDSPDSIYPMVSSVFHLDKNGVPDVKAAKEIMDNGQKVAKILVNAYSKGDITEENLRTGYTIKTQSGMRDIFIDETMLDKLDYAVRNNGKLDSDLVFYAAVQAEQAVPYKLVSNERGIKTTQPLKGYRNRLEATRSVSDVSTPVSKAKTAPNAVSVANKALAQEVTGNSKGMITFGGKEVTNERTGNTTIVGGKNYDAAKLYSTEYRLGRNESGDIIEKTSESKLKTLEDATERQLYASMGTKISKEEYAPTAFQKRYAESVIDRTKTELGDSGDSFNGSEWVHKIDKNAGDPELVKAYGIDNDITYTSMSKDGVKSSKPTNLAQQVKSLEQSGALGEFKYNLEKAAADVQAGKYDAMLPEGMSRDQLAATISRAKAFMESDEQYGYHPKASEVMSAKVDEEGNELDATVSYKDYASSDLYGNTEQIYGLQGRMIDLDKNNVKEHLDAFKLAVNAFADESHPLHEIFTSQELEDLRAAKIDFSNKSRTLAEDINNQAKALYESGTNPQFNKRVDQVYQDIKARTQKYGGKAGENELKYQYLEALGIAAPGSGLNSIGTGAYGQSTRRFYAAQTAKATGIEDMSEEGWSAAVTKMRLDAGNNAGYARQLTDGIELLKGYSGETKEITALTNRAYDLENSVSALVNAKPFNAEDNFENSAMAMFADVYDKKAMSPVANKAEIDQSLRDIKWRLDNIVNEIFTGKKAHIEGMTVKKVSNDTTNEVSVSMNQKINDASDFYLADNIRREAEYFTQYGKHDPEAKDPGVSLVEANRLYDDTLAKLHAQYGGDIPIDVFESRLLSAKKQAAGLSKAYHDLEAEYNAMGGDNIVAPFAAQGKTSVFTPEQLSYAAAKPTRAWTPADNAFDAKIGGENTRLTPEVDFGTAQELSDTAVGMRLVNATGDEVDLKSLTPEEAKAVMASLNDSLENSGLAVKESATLQTDTDVLQDLGNGYALVGTPKEDEPLREIVSNRGRYEESPQEISSRALAQYTEYTKNYNPAEQMAKAQKEYDTASNEMKKIKKQGDAAAKKVQKGTITIDDLAKKTLSESEYARYKQDADTYRALREKKPVEDGTDYYEALNGKYKIVNGQSIPAGHTTVKNLLDMLGYDQDKFNHDITEGRVYTDAEIKADMAQRKKMMKQVNKNLRKGNVKYRNVEKYKNPTALDLKSQTATINNLLAFCSQVSDVAAAKGEVIDPSKIVIDKDYADLLFRISREGVGPTNVKGYLKNTAFEITDWNKFVQDFQLAGGASYVNAMTIAQLRGAILSNPMKMAEYLKLVVDFKDDAAVANFVVSNSARLSDIAMKVGDASILKDFQAAASDKPGMEDGGTLSAFTHRIIENYNNAKAVKRTGGEKYDFAKDSVQNSVNALFADATFNRMLPVLRAKMLIENYDMAVRELKAHFKNIDGELLNDSACKYAYAKTTAFFEPNKTAGGLWKNKSISDTLDNIYDDNMRRFLSSWTGAKDEVSIGQMASNCFFALGYKQRMIQPLAQGAKSMFGIGNVMDRLSMAKAFDETTPDLLEKLGTQFMQSGNRQQLRSLGVIAIGAFITAKSLGLATAWDDLSFTDEADGEFKVPDILKKFQTIGQIWIPNAIDENGRPYVDPTKTAYNIDTMSSIFTLPNVGWKTIDRIFNPNSYYSSPQRGIGLFGQELGANAQGLNDFINSPLLRGIGDELIGSNLLSPYKAMYEVLVDSSYYGNNIWEKKWLSDGSENPNYDPVRNIKASFFHILGLDNYRTLSPRKYNDYVKGYYTDDYVAQDQIGSIGGSGILQHEYVTAIINIAEGDALEGVIEAGELPIKKQKFSSTARTDFNTRVKNIIAEAMAEYNNKTENETSADVKDAAYADAVKKAANAVASWSAKYDYVLGKDQSLVPYVTRSMMAVLAGEYDDRLDYIQNTYWKASQIAQIEATGPSGYWLDDSDIDSWLAAGKTAEEFAAEKNKRHDAYNQALDDEYRARKALHDAGIDNEYLAGMSVDNLKAEQRAVNKGAYTQAMGIVNGKIGEFDNFKEMKDYYESQIDAATTKKAKAKLANQYNTYLTDALAPVIEKYGAGIIGDGYYNNDYLSNHLSDYVIIPADKYYTGKSPRSSYLRDLFGVGYRDFSNEPSDEEVIAGYEQARKQMSKGNSASAVASLDRTIDAIKKGRIHVTDSDYSKIIRMRALLSARSK